MSWSRLVEWGDCDAAGIVFYPNFYRWFDAAFELLMNERGLGQRLLRERYGIAGTPLVETGARYLKPVTYGETVELGAHVSQWRNSSFTVSHIIRKDGETVVEGFEKRVWATRNEETGLLKALPIPDAFRDALGTGGKTGPATG